MPHIELPTIGPVYYEEFGDGPPLLFVSAGLATHAEWEHQVAALSADHRTVTFDWPGTGASGRSNIAYTAQVVVDAIALLIRELELVDATVVAHGIGVHAAILAAEEHPGLIHRLVLLGGAPWYGGERDGLVGGFAAEFTTWWLAQVSSATTTSVEAYDALGRQFLFHQTPPDSVVAWFVSGAVQWPLVVFNSYCADMADLDHRERLPRLPQPALVIQGRHDRKQRYEGAAILESLLPAGRLVTFEQSAHMVNLEEMAKFNGTVREFVREAR